MKSELLTISEFCKLANCGATYTYQLIGKGNLRALKVGRKTLIPRDSVNEWIGSLQPYPVQEEK